MTSQDDAGTVISRTERSCWIVQAGADGRWMDVSSGDSDRAVAVDTLNWRKDYAPQDLALRLVRDDKVSTRTIEIAHNDPTPCPPPLTGDDAYAVLRIVWGWIEGANNGTGSDVGDLMQELTDSGYDPEHIEGH